ncbi:MULTISPECIES: hypothetical protein [unclassified Mycobacterium]|uniref:hypothetical protein n=1 Tax=unclassified Mycobacterium TaxID=2642494 RepID=UPI0029C7BB82|nr:MULTISPECIES: hypothetical protein [unclassified Mycobacterium]
MLLDDWLAEAVEVAPELLRPGAVSKSAVVGWLVVLRAASDKSSLTRVRLVAAAGVDALDPAGASCTSGVGIDGAAELPASVSGDRLLDVDKVDDTSDPSGAAPSSEAAIEGTTGLVRSASGDASLGVDRVMVTAGMFPGSVTSGPPTP